MERVIDADQELYTGHCTGSARHTQQVDYFHYEHDMRARELPAGHARSAKRQPVRSCGTSPRRFGSMITPVLQARENR